MTREIALVGTLTLVALIAGVVVALNDGGPSVFGDETLYRNNANAIAALEPYATPHYPPFYPLILAMGSLFGAPYTGMLIVNSIASSATVPIVWFLAKSVGVRQVWVPVVLTAVLPIQGVYAGYLMSENVAVPIFCLSVALAVRGRRKEGPYLGLALAALHLTKYLFAPAVVLLLVVWIYGVARDRDRLMRPASAGVVRATVTSLAAYALPMLAWMIYGTASGASLGGIWGLSIVKRTAAQGVSEGSAINYLMWAHAYVAHLALATLIPLLLAAIWLVTRARRPSFRSGVTPQARFSIASLLLVVGYLALATQHSAGARYNLPEPSHMTGRYLVHLTPILIVLAIVMLEDMMRNGRAFAGWRVWVVTVTVVVLAWSSWSILFRKAVWGLPAWGVGLPFNAVDIYMLEQPIFLWMLILTCVLTAALLRARSVTIAAIPWISLAVVTLVASVMGTLASPTPGLRERNISDYLTQTAASRQSSIELWMNNHEFGAGPTSSALDFWGVDQNSVDTIGMSPDIASLVSDECVLGRGAAGPEPATYLMTSRELGLQEVFFNHDTASPVYLYALDADCAMTLTSID